MDDDDSVDLDYLYPEELPCNTPELKFRYDVVGK